jgi:hypothetical protein
MAIWAVTRLIRSRARAGREGGAGGGGVGNRTLRASTNFRVFHEGCRGVLRRPRVFRVHGQSRPRDPEKTSQSTLSSQRQPTNPRRTARPSLQPSSGLGPHCHTVMACQALPAAQDVLLLAFRVSSFAKALALALGPGRARRWQGYILRCTSIARVTEHRTRTARRPEVAASRRLLPNLPSAISIPYYSSCTRFQRASMQPSTPHIPEPEFGKPLPR